MLLNVRGGLLGSNIIQYNMYQKNLKNIHLDILMTLIFFLE